MLSPTLPVVALRCHRPIMSGLDCGTVLLAVVADIGFLQRPKILKSSEPSQDVESQAEAKKPVDPEATVSVAASLPFLHSLQSSRVQKHTESSLPTTTARSDRSGSGQQFNSSSLR